MAANSYSGGAGWGDGDILMDALATEKGQVKFYATAATESANPGVREMFLAFHGEGMHNLETTFYFLHTRGLYPTPVADQRQLHETIKRFQQAHSQLGVRESPTIRRYETAHPDLPPVAHAGGGEYDYKGDTLRQ